MTDSKNEKRLADARHKKGWTQKEIEDFAKRRAQELERLAKGNNDPDYLASGTQKTMKEISQDDTEND